MDKNIICFGEVLWDVYPERKVLGGAPFNVLSRLNSFGNNATLVSSIGNDIYGDQILNFFQTNNFCTDFLYVNEGYKTGEVKISLNSGEPLYNIETNVAWDYIPFKEKEFKKIDFLIFGSLASRNDTSFLTLKKLLKFSKFKILDLNLRQNYFTKKKLSVLIKSSDFLKLNLNEINELNELFNFHERNLINLQKKVFRYFNLKYLCLTNSNIFSSIYDGRKFTEVKSFNVESIDSVGAGDNFLAVFINEFFIKNNTISGSLKIAAAYGAITTTKSGATPDITEFEIDKILKNRLRIQ